MRPKLSLLCLALLPLLAMNVWAQETTANKKAAKRISPRTINADEMSGVIDKTLSASGKVEVLQEGTEIQTDKLDYDQPTDTATASGNVRMMRDGDVVTGDALTLKLESRVGHLDHATFLMVKRPPIVGESGRLGAGQLDAHVNAAKMNFEGPDNERLFNAQYSTCKIDDDQWHLSLSELSFDHGSATGTGYNASVIFKNVPILYLPYLTFPLNDERKSGFLPVSIGSSTSGGLELALPYYFNLAPDYDATITPKVFTRRGVQLGGEFRYQETSLLGEMNVEYMQHDRINNKSRLFAQLKHAQTFDRWLIPGLGISINAEKVSDDNYFRDLSTRIDNTTQTNLPRDFLIAYSGDWGAMSVRHLSYQTLQDPLAPIVLPYRLRPQFGFATPSVHLFGFDLAASGEYTDFIHPTLVNGKRRLLYPTISYSLVSSWGFLTPKFGYHFSRYDLGKNAHGFSSGKISLPVASLDSGLTFDRPTQFGQSAYTQTLEPRLFFLSVPFRDQRSLPSFTTTESTFSFPQLFNENLFIGGDRISDAKQVSAALTTRYIENSTGIERFRMALGQRYYFRPQQVALSDVALGSSGGGGGKISRSDLLAAFTGQLSDSWVLDSLFQYSSTNHQFQQSNVALRYKPETGTVLNLSYRYTRASIKQVDISTQMPLSKIAAGWTLLARANHSFQDRRLLEGLVGLEYNQGCWELRMVMHRFITATNQYSNSFQMQLELKGLSRLGISPLETLRQNISGYLQSDER